MKKEIGLWIDHTRILAIETVDKMTDRQIAAKFGSTFWHSVAKTVKTKLSN